MMSSQLSVTLVVTLVCDLIEVPINCHEWVVSLFPGNESHYKEKISNCWNTLIV